jgi:hypothetical protein
MEYSCVLGLVLQQAAPALFAQYVQSVDDATLQIIRDEAVRREQALREAESEAAASTAQRQ